MADSAIAAVRRLRTAGTRVDPSADAAVRLARGARTIPGNNSRMIDIRRRPFFWDAILVALIFIGGQQARSRYISLYQQTSHGEFYQDGFAAAATVGCGRPFRDVTVPSTALDEVRQL